MTRDMIMIIYHDMIDDAALMIEGEGGGGGGVMDFELFTRKKASLQALFSVLILVNSISSPPSNLALECGDGGNPETE